MERDPNISKLVRESGIARAPENLTSRVMDLIREEPEKQVYKPIIGKGGKWMIVLFIITIVVVSLLSAEPGQQIFSSEGVLSGIEWEIPRLTFNLDFLSKISPSTGLVAGLVALFILVLSDAGIRWRRMA